jgi:hypothetical protein
MNTVESGRREITIIREMLFSVGWYTAFKCAGLQETAEDDHPDDDRLRSDQRIGV